MPRLFISAEAIKGDRVLLGSDVARHLAGSLRVRAGERISVVDDSRKEHFIEVISATPHEIQARILDSKTAAGEPSVHVTVIQALAKDGMDMAIDAMVQAGVSEIRPVLSERTIARPTEERQGNRLARWQAIAKETAQQAFRAAIPAVRSISSLEQALGEVADSTQLLACVLAPDSKPISEVQLRGERVALCVGPEGGFGPRDLGLLRRADAVFVHLGPRVYRSRLAGAIAATLLLAGAGELVEVGQNSESADERE